MTDHRYAVGYLDEIEEIITLLEAEGIRVSVYKRYFPVWVKTVFNYPGNWKSTSDSISQTCIDHLENLINLAETVTVPIDAGKLATLALYLDAVEGHVLEDKTLDQATKTHVLAVLNNVRKAINRIDKIGDIEFRRQIEQLFATLASTEMASQEKDRWAHWSDVFVWPFVYDSAKFGAGFAFSQLQQSGLMDTVRQLTTGV